MRHGSGTVVLLGAKPAEGWQALNALGIPFTLIADEAEPVDAVDAVVGALEVRRAPFKRDPLSILSMSMPDRVSAVLSFTELGLFPAAVLSDLIGSPSVSIAAVLRTRNKLLMRNALAGQVVQPAYGLVGVNHPSISDFPLVVKPVDGSGSRGVDLISDAMSYEQALSVMQGWLWESYVEGPEFSVEAVSTAGRHEILVITEKHTTGPPYFIETGHTVPAELPANLVSVVHRCVHDCLDRLNITMGATHTEIKIRGEEVVLIETHTRAGGDRIPLLARLVTGRDQYHLAVQSVLQLPVTAMPVTKCHPVAGVRYFPWQDSTLLAVSGLSSCAAVDGVVEVAVDAQIGTAIPVWRYSHERPGYVVAQASSRSELDHRLSRALQLAEPVFALRTDD